MILTPNLRKIAHLSNNLELTIYSVYNEKFSFYVPIWLAFGAEISDLVTRLIINSQLTDNWQIT